MCVRDSTEHFFVIVVILAALYAAALRTWNGLNEAFHAFLCSMRCNEMYYVTAVPVLQPRIRRWWHRGKVPGHKSGEYECNIFLIYLWKINTEYMPVKVRHSYSGSTMIMILIVQVFLKISRNHKVQKYTDVANIHIGVGSPGIYIYFFPHWVKALAPEDIDSLTHCRAVRQAPVLRPRSLRETKVDIEFVPPSAMSSTYATTKRWWPPYWSFLRWASWFEKGVPVFQFSRVIKYFPHWVNNYLRLCGDLIQRFYIL